MIVRLHCNRTRRRWLPRLRNPNRLGVGLVHKVSGIGVERLGEVVGEPLEPADRRWPQ
jgi:hypothetical protein